MDHVEKLQIKQSATLKLNCTLTFWIPLLEIDEFDAISSRYKWDNIIENIVEFY